MKLAKMVASAMVVGSLGFGVATVGGAVASALPAAPMPLKPGNDGGNGHDNGNGHGNGHGNCRPWCDGPDFKHWDKGWDKGPWWANNRHDWWDDRNGQPPWGWGPPPPFQWNGGPLPQTINYWGYNANPVWDDGFRQWGIWLFGVWIPVFGVGIS